MKVMLSVDKKATKDQSASRFQATNVVTKHYAHCASRGVPQTMTDRLENCMNYRFPFPSKLIRPRCRW